MTTSATARLVLVGLLVCLTGAQANAYTIDTRLSTACHEEMTAQAIDDTVDNYASLAPAQAVPVPDDDKWRALADLVLDDVGLAPEGRTERFVLASLVLGARYPDTNGQAVTNLRNARQVHADPDKQARHTLRSDEDDYEEGNRQALGDARQLIRDRLAEASRLLEAPPDEQIGVRKTFIDFYGLVDFEVWLPAFHLGYALHTLQDSFSHTIRSEDLRHVYHVMNYAEALTEEHLPERDGWAHSGAMDECDGKADPIADVAEQATADLIEAFETDRQAGQISGQETAASEEVLDRWMSYLPGCTFENDFCDSPWVDVAKESQAAPLLERPAMLCATGANAGAPGALAGLAALLLGAAGWRRWRRWRR